MPCRSTIELPGVDLIGDGLDDLGATARLVASEAIGVVRSEAGPHPSGGLPPISYVAGGLENAAIRKAVCDILEGGEAAFRERARRLRVRLER
jgi:hypothetical protein